MNFLFGALLIVILLLPGFLFRLFYLAAGESNRLRFSITDEIGYAILPALVIQVSAFAVTNFFICDVDERAMYLLLINNDKVIITARSISLFTIYTMIVCFVAVVLGRGFRWISLKFDWHLQYRFLKIFNDWEEYFAGWVLNRPNIPGRQEDVEITWLDLVVVMNQKIFLYSGFLAYFTVTKEGKLDRVFLTGVRRKELLESEAQREQTAQENDSLQAIEENQENTEITTEGEAKEFENSEFYYYVPGDFFVVLGDEIKNINIIYLREE